VTVFGWVKHLGASIKLSVILVRKKQTGQTNQPTKKLKQKHKFFGEDKKRKCIEMGG